MVSIDFVIGGLFTALFRFSDGLNYAACDFVLQKYYARL